MGGLPSGRAIGLASRLEGSDTRSGMARPGTPSSRRLSASQLASEASAPRELVDELVLAGAIRPDSEGTHDADDVPRVRLANALTSGGIAVDDLMHEIRIGRMPFDQIPRMGINPQPTGRTFGAFAASLGDHAADLPGIYAAFGLALPPPETAMREDEEEAVAAFLEVWGMVDDRPEVFQRAARIVGEGIRHVVLGTLDLVDELGGSPPQRLARGLSVEDAIRPTVQQAPTMNKLLVWLRERHTENEVFGRIVAFTEASLARSGRTPARTVDPPAIAFVDLTGYTERTARGGDEGAARDATVLQAIAQSAASGHGGRVVKLLGDGVMMRFGSARDAVRAVREVMGRIVESGLPAAHAGIAAGPLVVRDGDVFGHTVNLAARIAAHSTSGVLLVAWDVTDSLTASEIEWEEADQAQLKGIGEPVRLARVLI